MAVTCDICGVRSELEETFTRVRSSFSSKTTIYCPACLQKRQESSSQLSVFWWGIFAVIGVIAASQGRWFLLNFFFVAVFTLLMIIPHELGHAFAAKWLGDGVFRIMVGTGRIVRKGTALGLAYEVRQFPFYGLTLSYAKSPDLHRVKRFLIVIAGPLVNFVFLLLALHIYRMQGPEVSSSTMLVPAWSIVVANIWILAINLFPHNCTLPQGKVPNDGLSLVKMPFSAKPNAEQIVSVGYILEGAEALSNQRFRHAKTIYRQGLAQYPENLLLKNGLGVACLELGEYEEARSIFSQLLGRNEPDKLIHATLLNNLAYTDILCDRLAFLEEADNLSLQVYKDFPWVPSFKGTRGIVLVELSRMDEGITLLKQAVEENEEPRFKAIDAAYLAIAEARKGSLQRAKQYLAAATQFDPTCSLLRLAQNEHSKTKEQRDVSWALTKTAANNIEFQARSPNIALIVKEP